MDRIPLETLLAPCASDGNVGQNLEYDSRFVAMCQCAEGTPEQEFGNTIVAAAEPDWGKLQQAAIELSISTRDLTLAVLLTESLCRTQGLVGLADGLKVVAGWTIDFWNDVYPQLDEEDGNDPVARVGALARLCRTEYLLGGLLNLPLADEPTLGSVTLRDLRRTAPTAEQSAETLTRQEIEAIFMSTPHDELRRTGDLLNECLKSVEELDDFLAKTIGIGQFDASPLLVALRECSNTVENAYGQRGGVVHLAPTQTAPVGEHESDDAPDSTQTTGDVAAAQTTRVTSKPTPVQIETRADAMEVLDCLCAYFQKYEPASPVPLLLQRAKRLIPMSFVDILRELAPDGLNQAMQSVGAVTED